MVEVTKKKKKKIIGREEGILIPPTPPPKDEAGTFVSRKTGKPSGITLPSGETFLGLSPAEVAEIQERKGLEQLPTFKKRTEARMREEETRQLLKEKIGKKPERVELDIEEEAGFPGVVEKVPVVGPGIAALARVISSAVGDPETFPVEALIQDPQTARDLALREIQEEVIKEGTTEAEKFGVFVEAIPVVGGLVSKYAGGLIETPSANANTIVQNILNEKERALNTAEMVRSGRLDYLTALDRLEGIEDNMIRLEQRLKLLANESPLLRADGDRLNQFETEILRAKERVEDARTSALGQVLKEPTDMDLSLTLQELRGSK